MMGSRAPLSLDALVSKVNSLLSCGNPREALALAYEYAAEFSRAGNLIGAARAEMLAARALCQLSRYEEAKRTYVRIERVFSDSGLEEDQADVYFGLGEILQNMTRYREALEYYKKARQINLRLGLPSKSAAASLKMAQTSMSMGEFSEALSLCESSRRVFEEVGQEDMVAQADKVMGTTLWYMDDYQGALDVLEESQKRFSRLGMAVQAAHVDNNKAIIYWKLNLYKEALDLFLKARGPLARAGMEMEAATIDINMGLVYTSMGRYEEALKCFDAGGTVLEARGVKTKAAWADYYRGKVAILLGRFEEALSRLDRAREVFSQQDIEVYIAQVDIYRAQAYLGLGLNQEAIPLYESSLSCGMRRNVPEIVFMCEHGLGRAKLDSSPGDAYDHFRSSIETIEGLRLGLKSDSLKTGFVSDKVTVYEDMAALCVRLGRKEEALLNLEGAKSQALGDVLGVRSPCAPATECCHFHSSGGDAQAAWMSPQYLQRACGARTTILDYYLTPAALMIFAIAGSEVYLHVDREAPGRVIDLLNWLRYDTYLMESSPPSFTRCNLNQLTRSHNQHLSLLYESLLRPVRDYLAGRTRILIIPHGPLHQLPFHALLDGEEYLIDRHEVFYAPSARVLQACMTTARRSIKTCLVVGMPDPDLPFVGEECSVIAGLFSGDCKEVLVGPDAKLDVVKRSMPRFDVIHFTGHGRFRSDNPMYSYVALFDSNLTAQDILDLKLTASLVTLSACEAGRTTILAGDEHLGFVRALLRAGVPSLVLSPWKVNDESTGRLMSDFYSHLKSGATKIESLRRAQLRLKECYPHPYYWAPFSLIGNPE